MAEICETSAKLISEVLKETKDHGTKITQFCTRLSAVEEAQKEERSDLKAIRDQLTIQTQDLKLMAKDVEHLGQKFEARIQNAERSAVSQGERIGELKASVDKHITEHERIEEKVDEHGKHMRKTILEPGEKYNKIVWLVLSVVITGLITALVAMALSSGGA